MRIAKPRIIKDYKKLDPEIIEHVKLSYPDGFEEHLLTYSDKEGNLHSALPFETDKVYYLIRMTRVQAAKIIEADDDYDEGGELRDEVKEDYMDKYEEEAEYQE